MKPLWACPECGETFTTKNQWHSCGTFDLDRHFARRPPLVRALFNRFVEIVRECGEVRVIPQKTRIAFQVRMRFAAVMPQNRALKGHLVLSRRHDDPCFVKVETYGPSTFVHVFRIASMSDFTEVFTERVHNAYRVGEQEPRVYGTQ